MAQIQIIETGFNAAADLKDLLLRRRLIVSGEEAEKAEALVCSTKYEQEVGGTKGVADKARSIGAKLLVIVEEDAAVFSTTEELGGRLIRISLPKAQSANMLHDGGLLMLSDILGGQFGAMVAADLQTGKLMDLAARVGRTDVTVFINGPTGTGKEVLARQVHASSRRKDAPFVAINCAAIPENMLEAILFGHEKGSFTGASTANRGIIRAADGGTLLLDEVSEMPMGLQAKLLRVLQEKAVTPLGSQKEVSVDIRVVATSNRDMIEEVRLGNFREDLYYRLNVFPLNTQALNERKDDIPSLAVAMVRRHTPADMPTPTFTADAMSELLSHDWQGNVRELENVIQRALVLHENGQITEDDIMITATMGLAPAFIPAADQLASVAA